VIAGAEFTPFDVLGVLLALWAVVVAWLGIRSPDFPSSGRSEKLVSGVFILLVAGTIAAGITSSYFEYQERHGHEGASAAAR
jgi:hypothetical protein